jgi:hypothetical protein
LVKELSHQLPSQWGENLVMDNKILYKVLFLHMGKTYEFLPHKDLGICGRDQFPSQGRLDTYAYQIDKGKPFPKSLKCNASPALYVLLQESVNEISKRV